MIWLNGALANAAGAVSAADRGLLLGEGVFETVLAENGTPSHWAAHMERLWRACDVLGSQPLMQRRICMTWQQI